MKLFDLQEVGSGREGTLTVNYSEIVDKVFAPNVTQLDDPDKVSASWAFKDENGREAFIWSYKYDGNLKDCNSFSICGDKSLFFDIFGSNVTFER